MLKIEDFVTQRHSRMELLLSVSARLRFKEQALHPFHDISPPAPARPWDFLPAGSYAFLTILILAVDSWPWPSSRGLHHGRNGIAHSCCCACGRCLGYWDRLGRESGAGRASWLLSWHAGLHRERRGRTGQCCAVPGWRLRRNHEPAMGLHSNTNAQIQQSSTLLGLYPLDTHDKVSNHQ